MNKCKHTSVSMVNGIFICDYCDHTDSKEYKKGLKKYIKWMKKQMKVALK